MQSDFSPHTQSWHRDLEAECDFSGILRVGGGTLCLWLWQEPLRSDPQPFPPFLGFTPTNAQRAQTFSSLYCSLLTGHRQQWRSWYQK